MTSEFSFSTITFRGWVRDTNVVTLRSVTAQKIVHAGVVVHVCGPKVSIDQLVAICTDPASTVYFTPSSHGLTIVTPAESVYTVLEP